MKTEEITQSLFEILKSIESKEATIDKFLEQIHDQYKLSAKNLFRYLMLRSHDLRHIHDYLSDLGISAMRSAEGYVYSNLHNVVRNLHLVQGKPFDHHPGIEIVGYKASKELVIQHANQLFNENLREHFVEIMVTLPLEAAEDKTIIEEMVQSGMEIARINLSHGTKDMWQQMVKYIHEIKAETKKDLNIYMDLAGPKIRTGEIEVINKKGKIRNRIKVRNGEHIILTKQEVKGSASNFDEGHIQTNKAIIPVMLPQIIDDVEIGDVILFDDGMIKGKVIAKSVDTAEIELLQCYKNALASQKGINLPNTKLNLPALTEKDIENLPFICENADIVGYSFVRTAEDVKFLYKQLEKINCKELGVVFKIENKEAFENLPQILFEGMKHNKIGVMIARGDLAVEIGFERISEVQNQILWICEAAHIPVVWATQVLENLAKTGIPTRSEISDAAQGASAECVMLNKGPYINDAILTLRDILIRMKPHAFKKKSSLRALNIAQNSIKVLEEVKIN